MLLELFFITLVSGIGIFLTLQKKISYNILNFLIALGAGSMISVALLHIFPEIIEHSKYGAIAFLAGFVGMYLFEEIFSVHKISHKHDDHSHEDSHSHYHHIAYATFFALFLHTIFDGMAIYASTHFNAVTSVAVIFGVIIHQIPLSLSLSAILKKSHIKNSYQIIFLGLFAIAIAMGYFFAHIFGNIFWEYFYAIAIAIAGGSLLYIATVDLLPTIHSENSKKFFNIFAFLLGIGIVSIFHFFGKDIHEHQHSHYEFHTEHQSDYE